nr:MAG: ORF1 [TTV-like mini virus]
MPWWYRNKYYPYRWNFRRTQRRRYKWPRRRLRRRRAFTTLRRRWTTYRRQPWVRKFKYLKKKKKSIILRQFQPPKIRRCTIKGNMCLLQCGPDRLHFNWTQYMDTVTPEKWQGGGGWSQIKFSLGSLFQQREYMNNYWTVSNVGLPLTRYRGCTFKFYRAKDIDYIVYYTTCQPMLDNVMLHATAQPANMLMRKHKIIVKSQRTKPNGKLWVKKRIRPPEQMQNRWYFQKELCNEGLLLLTTTLIDLDRYYLNPDACSNSITLTCINVTAFTNHNFQQSGMGTVDWTPNHNYWLYGARPGATLVKHLIYLGQTKTNEAGKEMSGFSNITEYRRNSNVNFGNPFHHRYLDDSYSIYSSAHNLEWCFQNSNKDKKITDAGSGFTEYTQYLLRKVRYCPNKDTGSTNTIYLLKNTDNSNWDPPADPDLKFSGFPLWTLFWGWTDWQVKLKKALRIHQDYIVCFQTNVINEKMTCYCPLDDSYIHGNPPYQTEGFNPQDWDIWYPSQRYQMMSIENICKTGPGVAKTSTKSLEAHCYYKFYFNWGGCPKDIQNINDPCQQPDYPVPHLELQGPETEDPETMSPTKELYKFDWRRDTLTAKATERLKKDSKSSILISTDTNRSDTQPTTTRSETFEKEDEASTEEEDQTPLQQQLQQLRQHRQLLKQRINRLITQTPSIKL